MTPSSILLVLASVGSFAAAAQTPYSCPLLPADGPTVISSADTSIRVPVTSSLDGLCTLVRRRVGSNNPSSRRKPVARSYAGRPWEVVAGLYANVAQSGLDVICSDVSGECDITLPTLPVDGSEEYILESYVHSSPSSDATAARFLEQATFGPTRSDIDALVAGGLDFNSWVEEQMTMEGKSSLREFYRRRVNPKFENSFKVGVSVSSSFVIYMCCMHV